MMRSSDMKAFSRAAPACLALLVALGCPSSVRADTRTRPSPPAEPSKAAMDEAKALYVAGNRAVEQGRWADALTSFDRSYELSGASAALFNSATTLRALGRHVDARDAFALLLDRHGKKLDPEIKKKAETMLTEERARVASLLLSGLPAMGPELRLLIDGNASPDSGTRPLSLEVDPGRHSVNVEAERAKPFAWEGVVGDGEKKTVTIRLIPADPVATTSSLPPPPPPPETAPSSSVFASPIFWGVVGVVVLGGAAAGGYYWHKGRQLEPASGTVVHL
jgi:hypothetical protein